MSFSHLRSVLWMCPLIGLSVLVMGSISLAASLFDGTGRLQHRVATAWGRMVLAICMVKVEVSGKEKLDPRRNYVFCSNHFSLIDTPLMFGAMPREFRILARDNLWKIPFLGWHLKRAGHLPVQRENPREAVRNIALAAEKIQSGISILLFPEGGRTREDRMRPFKTGVAHIAIKAGVPVVPMAIVGTRDILPPSSSHLHPGTARLIVGEPIPTDGLRNRDALEFTKRVQAEVAVLYDGAQRQPRPSEAANS
jgi:1-acyl-sn-glycerol-3-phosphate acyltransferase